MNPKVPVNPLEPIPDPPYRDPGDASAFSGLDYDVVSEPIEQAPPIKPPPAKAPVEPTADRTNLDNPREGQGGVIGWSP